MNNYHIEGSDRSPSVFIDGNAGIIEISGLHKFKSPELLFKNVTRWMLTFKRYFANTRKINIRLFRLNKSSVKWLKHMLEKLEKISTAFVNPKINWYWSYQDDFVLKMGEKYRSVLNFSSNIIAA